MQPVFVVGKTHTLMSGYCRLQYDNQYETHTGKYIVKDVQGIIRRYLENCISDLNHGNRKFMQLRHTLDQRVITPGFNYPLFV